MRINKKNKPLKHLTRWRPIHTSHLFMPLARRLIRLLHSLSPDQWEASTCYPSWKVKDIASHLIQTGIARLSHHRDHEGSASVTGPESFSSISVFIAQANETWHTMTTHWSPRLITEILTVTEPALARFLSSLEPEAPAFFAVAWAGENESANWFDVAREYTERWHHQEQIREAVGAPQLTRKRFLGPVVTTLMRAFPFWYGDMPADPGTVIRVHVTGRAGGEWYIRKGDAIWQFIHPEDDRPSAATITLSCDTAWKLLTRSITPGQARPLIDLNGDQKLGERFLEVKAIMMND